MWEAFIWAVISILLGFGWWGMTLNPPNYTLTRLCFLLAALVFLGRLSWWILVEHQFMSRILIYFLIFVIYGAVGIALVYGLQSVSYQEHEYKEQIKANIKVEKRLSILENLQVQAAKNQDALEKKYPKGYALFASEKHVIYVPVSKGKKHDFNLDWADSRIAYVDSSFVVILLRSLHYYPNEIQVKNLNIVLERRVGSLADGIYFNDIGMFVELIDDKANEITYVIGCKSVGSIPKKRELKPEVEKFVRKLGIGPLMSAINTNIQKYIDIQDLTISSGWKTIEN